MRVSMRRCKWRLAVLWFCGGGLVFMLLFCQTLFGHYESAVARAWGWALPTVMPTLSLMMGVLVADAIGTSRLGQKTSDRSLFRLVFCLSAVYLGCILLTLLLQPICTGNPTDVLTSANLWLGPFQGLVAAGLGAFFVRGEDKKQ